MLATLRLRSFAAAAALCIAAGAAAQDLTITNGRILDGTGNVIERGHVVVRGGKIASVGAGAPSTRAGRTIDARGKTVMPGFIDAHRHLVQGDGQRWLDETAAAQMQEFLEAGFTTVLSAIDPPQVLEAKQRIQQGTLRGPRIYAGTLIPLSGMSFGGGGDPARTDPSRGPRTGPAAPAIPRETTIAAVNRAAQAGYDYIKTLMIRTQNGPEVDTLKLLVEEGKKHNLPVIVHAVSVLDTLAAVEGRPAVLVHTPHIGHLGDDAAAVETIVDAGIPMTSTLAVFIPHFNTQNEPLFRDALPFPWNTLSSAGQGPVNARLLWEAGVSYGYGTDTQWPPKQSLNDEVRALALVFSPADIVTILTRNAARSMLKADELGTLEPGKLADIVLIDGDPLARTDDLQKVVTTIKGGEVLFQAR